MPREGKARVLTEPEFNRIVRLQKTNRHAARNTALLFMSFGLGLRAKELAALSIADVLLPCNELKSTINLTSDKTKGGKQRHVYLSSTKVIPALSSYLTDKKRYSDHEPLFLSQKGGRFSPNSLQMLFARMYRDAGLDGASSHSGRRTFATRLIERGVDIKAVSRLMGHSTISMTAEYVEDNPERLKKIAEVAI
ncbi:hypothetical protein BOW53_04190 [Solemya pervernicosa gill symbiont]|uniref:Tyr recombinase domain-containing protein n=1 Tax=Solemya pervernicosa gill symbiont TaxID=642797 RepID=A0A1T2L8B0_9GAMM|nr:site-specific integrase [Solemya pervernicosa gill symbiont]OOZ41323.1 hypothetical protein BOW53_04190 [Solemya pervernicosa gill symbiont]